MRGQPDFGIYAPATVGSGLSDLGEAAVRLGSIVSFDRRGRVVVLDDFEAPVLAWSAGGFGAGTKAILTSDYVFMKSQSLKLLTVDTSGSYSQVSRTFSILGSKRIGLEIAHSSIGVRLDLILEVRYREGTNTYTAKIKVARQDLKVYYFDSDSIWSELVDLPKIPTLDGYFSITKVVFDFDTGKFVRLLINTNEWDISSFSIPLATGDVVSDVRIILQVINRDATGDIAYLDNFILTHDEP